MQEKIKNLVIEVLKKEKLIINNFDFAIEHPADLKNGDYSTNVAMILAKNLKTEPKELAEKIIDAMSKIPLDIIEKIEEKNGFINFYLSQKFFQDSIKNILENKYFGKNDSLKGKKIMVEHTDPNPFKEFHIGHFMPNIIGSTIARILFWNGGEVKEVCYQGDVGLHVAKAIWGYLQSRDWKTSYTFGSKRYEEDEAVKKEVRELNKKIYQKSPEIWNIYEEGKHASLEAFEKMYKKLGTKFDYYFFESEVSDFGKEIVENNLGGVFEKGEKEAIIFKAENFDKNLHTRVFINSEGLPTYEAKELGLVKIKYDKYNYDQSIIITGNEINEYFKVLLCAIKQIFPELAEKTLHFSHGILRLPTGKMSSRTGDVITAESLIDMVKEKVKGDKRVAIGAIKYMILRQAIGGDIIFDIEKSVSTEGDSGVYLQYSYARANSILEKAKIQNLSNLDIGCPKDWQTTELEKLLYRFPEVVLRAGQEFAPHYIVGYLTELARAYNNFYGNNQIVDPDDLSSPYKVAMSGAFTTVMKNGLNILGIPVLEKM